VRNIHSLLLGLFVGGAVFGSANLLRADHPRTAPATSQVGRYQLTSPAKNDEVWLLDTATGDTWYRHTSSRWTKAGNPTADRK
jgi:hypothetical protein